MTFFFVYLCLGPHRFVYPPKIQIYQPKYKTAAKPVHALSERRQIEKEEKERRESERAPEQEEESGRVSASRTREFVRTQVQRSTEFV